MVFSRCEGNKKRMEEQGTRKEIGKERKLKGRKRKKKE